MKLQAALEAANINAFVAKKDIPPGNRWDADIRANLDACDYFLVVLTARYQHGQFTCQEYGMADAKGKKILIVDFDGTKPFGFMWNINCIEMKDIGSVDDDKSYETLVRDVLFKAEAAVVDTFVEKFCNAAHFREANEFNHELAKLRARFTDTQIKLLAKACVSNYEIYHAFYIDYVLSELEESMDKIDNDVAEELKKLIKKRRDRLK